MLTTWDKVYALISRPAIAFAAVALILVLNIFIISSYRNNESIRFQGDSNSEWQTYSTVTNKALYDVENNIEP